jgi:DNA-binding CsgD family transcriptional regulator
MDDDRVERLATLFRVLADPTRLRILGLLADRPHSGRELCDRLELTPPTVSHHLRRLTELGIVSATPRAQSISYALDLAALRQATELSGADLGSEGPALDATASATDRERTKVVRDFFDGERLKQIPAQRKKRVIVLEHLLARFEPGTDYPERSVNELLRPAHDDVATLRRELVDYGYLNRERGVYRVAASLPARGPTVAQEVRPDEHDWLRRLLSDATRRALTTPASPAPQTRALRPE